MWISGSERGVTPAIERKLKRRNAAEPVIGHLKSNGRLARNFLKGIEGDAMNALLCCAGRNLRKILRKLRLFYAICRFTLRQLLALVRLPAAIAQTMNWRCAHGTAKRAPWSRWIFSFGIFGPRLQLIPVI